MTAQMTPPALTAEQRTTLHCPDWCESGHAPWDVEEAPKDPANHWIVHDGPDTLFGKAGEQPVPVCRTQSTLLDGTVLERGLLIDNSTLDKPQVLALIEYAQRVADSL